MPPPSVYGISEHPFRRSDHLVQLETGRSYFVDWTVSTILSFTAPIQAGVDDMTNRFRQKDPHTGGQEDCSASRGNWSSMLSYSKMDTHVSTT